MRRQIPKDCEAAYQKGIIAAQRGDASETNPYNPRGFRIIWWSRGYHDAITCCGLTLPAGVGKYGCPDCNGEKAKP